MPPNKPSPRIRRNDPSVGLRATSRCQSRACACRTSCRRNYVSHKRRRSRFKCQSQACACRTSYHQNYVSLKNRRSRFKCRNRVCACRMSCHQNYALLKTRRNGQLVPRRAHSIRRTCKCVRRKNSPRNYAPRSNRPPHRPHRR